MDFKKIKKSGATLTGVLISMLLVIGIFLTMYNYLGSHADSAGISMQNYSNTTYHLEHAKDSLDTNINDIKNNLNNITEAESGFLVAINGFRGLGNILKLPITFVKVGNEVMDALIGTLGDYGKLASVQIIIKLLIIGIIGLIVFLIVAIVKGEQQKL